MSGFPLGYSLELKIFTPDPCGREYWKEILSIRISNKVFTFTRRNVIEYLNSNFKKSFESAVSCFKKLIENSAENGSLETVIIKEDLDEFFTSLQKNTSTCEYQPNPTIIEIEPGTDVEKPFFNMKSFPNEDEILGQL